MGAPGIHLISSPFEQLHILRYIASLVNSGFSYPSILSRISAITYWIRFKNWPLVTRSFMITQSLKGVRAMASSSHSAKFPITPDVLRALCRALRQVPLHESERIRLKAIFLLSFYAFLRVGEVCGSRHSILLDNICIQPTYISIDFPSYKFSLGRCPTVFIPALDSDLCPVKALTAYLQLRGSRPGLLFANSDGSPCVINQYRSVLARVVHAAGLSGRGITPHSFRVGAATSAAAVGIPEETIQRMGRWTSRAFMRYIKFQINRF